MHAHFGFIYQFQQLIQDVCGKLKHHKKTKQTGISEVKRQTGISEVIAHKKKCYNNQIPLCIFQTNSSSCKIMATYPK